MKTCILLITIAFTAGQQFQQRNVIDPAVRLAIPGFFQQGSNFGSNSLNNNNNNNQFQSSSSQSNNLGFQNQGINSQTVAIISSDINSDQSRFSQNNNQLQSGFQLSQQNNRDQFQTQPFQTSINQQNTGSSITSIPVQFTLSNQFQSSSQLPSSQTSTNNQFQQSTGSTFSNFNQQNSGTNSQSSQSSSFQNQNSGSQSASFQNQNSGSFTNDFTEGVNGVFEPLNLPSGASRLLGSISTSFTCVDKPYGYYADEENSCRVFHICNPALFSDGEIQTYQYSFMCGEGSIFDQDELTCKAEYDATPCQQSASFFFRNEQFGREQDKSF